MNVYSHAHAEEAAAAKADFAKREPLAEGPVKRRYIRWSTLGEGEFLETVNRIVREKGIRSMRQMKGEDSSMFKAVRERGLEGKVSFPNGKAAAPGPGQDVEAADAPGKQDPPKAPGEDGSKGVPLTAQEIAQLAQMVVDEGGLRGMEELELLDPEIAGAVRGHGIGGLLVFAPQESPPVPEEAGNGGRRQENGAITEEEMFRRICAECFRVCGGNAFLGARRGTIPKLQGTLKRKLAGAEHRMFKRCWDRMEAEGAIMYNSNKSAASLNLYCEPRTESLRAALLWAASECGPQKAHL